ncbi:Lysophospholipase [Hortaea werneckii]|nr:Lysophospholipase [Hortaea werneckii]
MNMTTLLLTLFAFASTVAWFRKDPQIDIFPDTPETDTKPGLSNCFDEFLSAIKVFGFLERPVFHELTRTMQTRKLIAGETILLEEEKGFCLVVDGLVQIFVKSNQASENDSGNDYTDDDHAEERDKANSSYQLLTEVKNGAPMSSLFSVLSLFTENVKLRHDQDEEPPLEHSHSSLNLRQQGRFSSSHVDGNVTPDSSVESPAAFSRSSSRPTSRHRRLSTMTAAEPQ